MTALIGLKCLRCGREPAAGTLPYAGCPHCAAAGAPANWTTVYDLALARPSLGRQELAGRPQGVWRYAELLPVAAADPVTLGEGGTPLLPAPRLAQRLGLKQLWVKDDSQNPTWSFKDRAASVAATHARALGKPALVVSSTGNAGAATAAYAPPAGGFAIVLAAKTHDPVMSALIQAYGACMVATPAKADRWTLMTRCVEDWGCYPNSTYVNPPVGNNPYALDGYKTIAYEIWEQLGRRAPEWVFLPAGYGDGLYGVYKGFSELAAMAYVSAVPKMGGAEVYGSLTRTLAAGGDAIVPGSVDRDSVAFSIGPVQSTYQALRACKDSGGAVSHVDDAAVLAAQRWLAEDEGLFAETASAAPLAALAAQVQDGTVRSESEAVLVITSGGLKSTRVVPPGRSEVPLVAEVSLQGLAGVLQREYGWVPGSGKEGSQ